MRKLFIFILLLCGTFAAAADSAVILDESVKIRIDGEGKITRHVDRTVQLNSFRSLRSLGEWFYSFNPELEQVEILKSVTIQTDGTEVPMPDNARLLQTPYAVQHAPDFSGIREMMVSHTGLEPGCRVHFEYRTTDLKPHRLVHVEWMADHYPIRKKTVIIENDMDCPVSVNGDILVSGNTYTVEQQLPVLSGGMFDTPVHRAFLTIQLKDPVKTLRKTVTHAWKNMDLDSTVQTLSLNPDTAAPIVREAIRDLLTTRLDTVDMEGSLVGYGLRSAARIVHSGYATDLEKAALASAILTRYDIDHTVILSDDTLEGLPLLTDPHFIVQAGFPLYPETHQSGTQSCMALVGDAVMAGNTDRYVIGGELKEKEDGFKGELAFEIQATDNGTDIHYLTPIKGLKLENSRIHLKDGHHLMASASVSMAGPEKTIDLLDLADQLFHVNALAHNGLWCNALTIPREGQLEVDIVLVWNEDPDITLPGPASVSNNWGDSMVQWELKGNRLRIRYRFNLKDGTALESDMEQIRALTAIPANPVNRTAFIN